MNKKTNDHSRKTNENVNEKKQAKINIANRVNTKKYDKNPMMGTVSMTAIIEKRNKIFKSTSKQIIGLANYETGEAFGKQNFMLPDKRDTTPFMKHFVKIEIELGYIKRYEPQLRVMKFIESEVEPEHDYVLFDIEKCKEVTGLCARTIQKHIANLLNIEWIFESRMKNKYYINSALIWNGTRVKYIETCNIITQNVKQPKTVLRTIKKPKSTKIIQIDNGKAKEQV